MFVTISFGILFKLGDAQKVTQCIKMASLDYMFFLHQAYYGVLPILTKTIVNSYFGN
jgi:hypothetical protein